MHAVECMLFPREQRGDPDAGVCVRSNVFYTPENKEKTQMLLCRTSEELMLYLGAALGYWRGDIKGLVDDIGTLFNSWHPYPLSLNNNSN